MLLFIAIPIVSTFVQSLFIQHEQVLILSKNCGPFGCSETTSVDIEATKELRQGSHLGKFNGVGTYLNRSHLAFVEVGNAWVASKTFSGFLNEVLDLPFYGALMLSLIHI